MMAEESCPFSPVIYTKGSRGGFKPPNDDRPVHERLYEKGKEYHESHQRRLDYYSSVDMNDGSKLFAPRIVHQAHDVHAASTQNPAHNAHVASADEFLYQDAKDRELRLQQLKQSYSQQVYEWDLPLS
ncbi:hypothetical protein EON65_10470 [archaeon]|nr:MAG: hypothetical protein EON65_10470 [archaeon]